ncbi:MAG: hypothetical protein DRN81_03605 [Thermoproteota archaeon]|nr:MAG: hypothetical protein DRN81_03605 [Candidatus Korarchaeota archaeon]
MELVRWVEVFERCLREVVGGRRVGRFAFPEAAVVGEDEVRGAVEFFRRCMESLEYDLEEGFRVLLGGEG